MKQIFSVIVTLLFTTGAILAQVTFKASVQGGGNTVEAGTRFQLEYELSATCDNFECDLSNCGVRAISGPFSSTYMSRSISGGKSVVSNTTTYTYVMVADKEGTYTIPAAKAVSGGKTYTSNTIELKVLAADPSKKQAQSGNRQNRNSASSAGTIGKDDIVLSMDLSKTTVYEGEALVATMKLYFRNQNISTLSDVKFPDLEGFTAQEMDLGDVQATTEEFRGSVYRAYPVRQWLLFPQHAGDISIKPGSVTAIVQVYTGRHSFWDDPFSTYQNVQVPVTGKERTVRVKPMPAGKPASYMNAIGDFSIKSELTSDHVKANDAVIYRITVEGTGNLKYVREPQPEFPADFEVYDPKTDLKSRTGRNGISGKKIIEYTIIPRFAGTFTIPPVEFGYFDTKAGAYKTAQTQAFTLEVEKGAGDASGNGSGSIDFSGSNQERIKVLGSDIRYLHNIDTDQLQPEKAPMFGTDSYWLWFLVPTTLLGFALYYYRRNLKLRADIVGQRTRKANKVATKRLKSAAAALKQQDKAAFYESVHKAMLGYVADKLNIQLSDLTGDSIQEELLKRKVDQEIVDQCKQVIETCEFARYAPSTDAQAMDKLYDEAARTIDRLEKAL
ncbi:MAG: protein BatD [Bacteroidales bacterium]|nr:protein BatD [Bacteroidales bacterium]